MPIDKGAWQALRDELDASGATLVAVSKMQSAADIRTLYDYGQRDFGENYVQELVQKRGELPDDVRWHFIGHLQTNKVKLIAPFVYMVHGVDSLRLLQAVDRQAGLAGREVRCLLQVHIAREETKFGLDSAELDALLDATADGSALPNVRLCGLMGMASFTDDADRVAGEFRHLRAVFDRLRVGRMAGRADFHVLSMGMSGDFRIALRHGSTLVRIGSLLFGPRTRPA
jgi:pyridoxal phosphate enzyme (YggS family)